MIAESESFSACIVLVLYFQPEDSRSQFLPTIRSLNSVSSNQKFLALNFPQSSDFQLYMPGHSCGGANRNEKGPDSQNWQWVLDLVLLNSNI